MNAIEAMETCRSIRSFRPDPVPDDLIREVIRAATCAPSPENSQGWEFIVVRDPVAKSALAESLGNRLREHWGDEDLLLSNPEGRRRRDVLAMAESFADVPVIVFVGGIPSYPPAAPAEHFLWPMLYPAAQNLIVAARSLGLASAFTMLHVFAPGDVRKCIEIPDEFRLAVTIPLGWPVKSFGPVNRKPVEEVIHWDRWTGRTSAIDHS